jgi:Tol biopolymer transport system component
MVPTKKVEYWIFFSNNWKLDIKECNQTLWEFQVLVFVTLFITEGTMNANQLGKFPLLFLVIALMISGCNTKPKYLNSEIPNVVNDISNFTSLNSPFVGKIFSILSIYGVPQLFITNPSSIGNSEGNDENQLTYIKNGVVSPSASPDGNFISFFSPENNDNDLFVIKTNGSELTNLTQGQYQAVAPAWSPDSHEIAFSSKNNNNQYDLLIMDIFTKNVRKLLEHPSSAFTHNTWSPSGNQIAFVYRPRDSKIENIYIVNSDGSNFQKLNPNKNRAEYYPDWSPDGQKIAFIGGEIGDLYIINADGSNLQKYNSQSCKQGYSNPLWSPDSQHLAALCNRENITYLEIIDTFNLQQPSINFGSSNSFTFSPDGKYIWSYNPPAGGYLADIDGNNQTPFMFNDDRIMWVPDSNVNQIVAPVEQRQANAACGNSYWPIVVGAKWTYQFVEPDGHTSTIEQEITGFQIIDDSTAEIIINGYTIRCWEGSLQSGNLLDYYLPSEDNIFNGNLVSDYTGRKYSVTGPDSFEVNGSLVDAYKICQGNFYEYCTYWSKGIGKVAQATPDDQMTLISYVIPSENSTVVQPVITPVPVSTIESCNNPYWPVIQGAWWKYFMRGDTLSSPDHTWVDTINSISRSGEKVVFTISSAEVGGSSVKNKTYSCDAAGWIYDGNGNAILPPEALLSEGYQWTLTDGTVLSVHFMQLSESRTSLGIMDVLQIAYVGNMYWELYTRGIGPYGFGTGASSADLVEYFLPETVISNPPASDEAQIRYILADGQLGGIDYYRNFLDQPAVAEAVRRWDACVRVSNLDQFERKDVPNKGWLVTYKNTEQQIDGMDVILSAGGCSTTNSLCGNPYFPVKEGAQWTYYQTTSTGEAIETGPATYTVENVKDNGSGGYNFIWMLSYGGIDYNIMELSCDGGIIHKGGVIWTPSVSDMVAEFQFPFGDLMRTVFPLTTISTRMGTFNAIPICDNGSVYQCIYFVENIGMVQITENGIPTWDIISYSIP